MFNKLFFVVLSADFLKMSDREKTKTTPQKKGLVRAQDETDVTTKVVTNKDENGDEMTYEDNKEKMTKEEERQKLDYQQHIRQNQKHQPQSQVVRNNNVKNNGFANRDIQPRSDNH